MQACAWSVALVGLEGRVVEVEADIGSGLPRTVLVGLADTALSEARDRCKAAVGNTGHTWPASLLTINLSPATLPKTGSHYDLAIVAAVLAAAEVIPRAELAGTVLLGELGLDGRVRPGGRDPARRTAAVPFSGQDISRHSACSLAARYGVGHSARPSLIRDYLD